MLSIAELSISNFKKAENVTFPVGELNVIVGGNNSGKSSSIQGLHFFFTLLQSIELAGKWQKTLRTTVAPEELIYSPAQDPYRLYSDGYLQQSDFINFEITLTDGRVVNSDVTKGKNANLSAFATPVAAAKELASLTSPFSVFSPGLAGITRQENYVSDGVLLRAVSRGDANLFLRNIILRLHGSKNWPQFTDDLAELFPVSIEVYFEEESDELIIVEAKFGDREVPLESCGTGLLQAIQILSYVHYFRPAIMILDEPDSHLHPDNQRRLCDLLEKINVEYGSRIILTTHSRHMLDTLKSKAQLIWMQSGSASVASPDDCLDILMDLGALDIREVAEKDLNFFLFTEDKEPKPISALLESSGFEPSEFGVFSYRGVANINSAKIVTKFVREMRPDAVIILHRDRDYLSDDEVAQWEVDVRQHGLQPFITSGRDVEHSFLNPEYLAEMNQVLSESDAKELIKEAAEELRHSAIQDYTNARIASMRTMGKTNPNIGSIAAEAAAAVADDLEASLKGKDTLKRVRRVFQEKHGTNLRQIVPSALVSDPKLEKIRKKKAAAK